MSHKREKKRVTENGNYFSTVNMTGKVEVKLVKWKKNSENIEWKYCGKQKLKF